MEEKEQEWNGVEEGRKQWSLKQCKECVRFEDG